MSLLKSYSFGLQVGFSELPSEVIDLFSVLVEKPEKKIDYASEIVESGLRRIKKGESYKNLNLAAFEAKISRNQFLTKEKSRFKLSFIDSETPDEADSIGRNGGISEDVLPTRVFEKVKDAYEEVILSDELSYAIEKIKCFNDQLFVEEGIDIITALKQAVKCIPEAVEEIRRVCSEYTEISELVYAVLNSGKEVESLFA